MNLISNYIKGILIGAGAIIPGISSGVLCVIFGIYESILDSVLNFFKNWKKNLIFLAPLFLGGLTGIILFSNIILYFFEKYPEITSFSFIGLILGCIPAILRISNDKNKFNLRYLFCFLITFITAISLIFLEAYISKYAEFNYSNNFSFSFLVLSGFLMSIGVVVPGVSNTIILMLLGVYETYLHSVSTLNFGILIPMGIGLLIGGFLWMKLIQFLLKKYHSETYFSILGFIIGSIFILIPKIEFNLTGLFALLSCLLGFLISFKLEKIKG